MDAGLWTLNSAVLTERKKGLKTLEGMSIFPVECEGNMKHNKAYQ